MTALMSSAGQALPIAGLRLGVAAAEIRKKNRDDVCVLLLDEGATVGGVFTQNRFCAAPVQICQAHLRGNAAGVRALVINTGVANAGTGEQGLADAHTTCTSLAKILSCTEQAVLPFSTGVIMEPLPVQRLIEALPVALMDAKEDNWERAARSIMTTDTVPKVASAELSIDGHLVRVSGMSKGSGMIHPNMATMLGFMATDAYIAPELMADLSKRLADVSFNRITVDGDTSTNDSFVLMATGKQSQVRIETLEDLLASPLWESLIEVAQRLAQAIVRDGEGASKLIQIEVSEGVNESECLQVARAIAHSPLVKTAFFASDPNLGRILAAVGYAGIADLAQERIRLSLGDVLVVENGARVPSYREEDGQRVMAAAEINVYVGLGRGQARAVLWTCDLSYDYVRINADYRS